MAEKTEVEVLREQVRVLSGAADAAARTFRRYEQLHVLRAEEVDPEGLLTEAARSFEKSRANAKEAQALEDALSQVAALEREYERAAAYDPNTPLAAVQSTAPANRPNAWPYTWPYDPKS